MNSDFIPNSEANPAEYEALLKLASDAGYSAVDLSAMEFERFGVETVKTLLDSVPGPAWCIITAAVL